MMCESQYTIGATDICAGDLKQFCQQLKEQDFRIDYRPSDYDPEEGTSDEFNWVVKLCYLKKHIQLFIEEAHMFCTPHRLPADLMVAIRMGRHRGLSIVYITQSYAAVTRPLTANTNRFYFFGMFDPREIEAIAERTGWECAEAVRSLKRLEVDGQGEVQQAGEIIEWRDNGEWKQVHV